MTNQNPTSTELIKRSEALREQAERLKRKEIPEVVARIKDAISHYGLTAQDLGLPGSASAGRAAKKAVKEPVAKKRAAKRSASVKYRDQNGHAWSGFGPKPKWLKDALASGVSEESLRA